MESFLSQDLTQVDSSRVHDTRINRIWKNTLPSDSATKSVSHDVVFQILDITDITRSKLSVLEELEQFENPEDGYVDRQNKTVKKKLTVITSVNLDNNLPPPTTYPSRSSVYKIILQDSSGNMVYAIEKEPLSFLNSGNSFLVPVSLGSKVIVKKNSVLQRGVLMLANRDLEFLGGKIDLWNQGYVARTVALIKRQLGK